MQNDDSDRGSLSQAELLEGLRSAKARFSRQTRSAENAALAAKTRAARSAARAAKRLPSKVANKSARQSRYKLRLATARLAERAAIQAEAVAMVTDLPSVPVALDAQALAADDTAFQRWLLTDGREQGAARNIERRAPGELMATREALLRARAEGSNVSWASYADRFGALTGRPWSREQARRRVAFLMKLEGEGGAW